MAGKGRLTYHQNSLFDTSAQLMAITHTLLVSAVSIWLLLTLQVLRPFAGGLTTLITEESIQLDWLIGVQTCGLW